METAANDNDHHHLQRVDSILKSDIDRTLASPKYVANRFKKNLDKVKSGSQYFHNQCFKLPMLNSRSRISQPKFVSSSLATLAKEIPQALMQMNNDLPRLNQNSDDEQSEHSPANDINVDNLPTHEHLKKKNRLVFYHVHNEQVRNKLSSRHSRTNRVSIAETPRRGQSSVESESDFLQEYQYVRPPIPLEYISKNNYLLGNLKRASLQKITMKG